MNIEEAFNTARSYEVRIRDFYLSASEEAHDKAAAALYAALGKDEASHVSYLDAKLAQWKSEGRVTVEKLKTYLPDPALIEAAAKKARAEAAFESEGGETGAIERALRSEEETSAFYRRLVSELDGTLKELFSRFLEIEEGHTRIVRAELDLATSTGFWFDEREFTLDD
jgi:rubrerythrin